MSKDLKTMSDISCEYDIDNPNNGFTDITLTYMTPDSKTISVSFNKIDNNGYDDLDEVLPIIEAFLKAMGFVLGERMLQLVPWEEYDYTVAVTENDYANSLNPIELMKMGCAVKREHWGGYWFMEDDEVVIHNKNGEELYLRDTLDMPTTLENLTFNDWMIAERVIG